MKLRDIMMTDVATIEEDASIGGALQTMLWSGARHLPVMRADTIARRRLGTVPVVDERSRLAGVISYVDLLKLQFGRTDAATR